MADNGDQRNEWIMAVRNRFSIKVSHRQRILQAENVTISTDYLFNCVTQERKAQEEKQRLAHIEEEKKRQIQKKLDKEQKEQKKNELDEFDYSKNKDKVAGFLKDRLKAQLQSIKKERDQDDLSDTTEDGKFNLPWN